MKYNMQNTSRLSVDYSGFRQLGYSHRSLGSERHRRRPFLFSKGGLVAIGSIILTTILIIGALLLEEHLKQEAINQRPVNTEPRLTPHIRTTLLIAGAVHSGTSLLRAVLGLHPNIFCRGESVDLYEYLQNVTTDKSDPLQFGRILGSKNTVSSSIKPTANITCDSMQKPEAKLTWLVRQHRRPMQVIVMVRDPRSTISPDTTTLEGYRKHFQKWNVDTEQRVDECKSLEKDTCIIIHYENLVKYAKETLTGILEFLRVPWSDDVIHRQPKKLDGILGELEVQFEERLKPIYSHQTISWGRLSEDIIEKLPEWAPMMETLGYNYNSTSDNQIIAASPESE